MIRLTEFRPFGCHICPDVSETCYIDIYFILKITYQQKLHPDIVAEYEASKISLKRLATACAAEAGTSSAKKLKQQSVDSMFKTSQTTGTANVITKGGLEKRLSFIANGMLPLSTVDNEEFRDLVSCKYDTLQPFKKF